jgi:hypothetical protein
VNQENIKKLQYIGLVATSRHNMQGQVLEQQPIQESKGLASLENAPKALGWYVDPPRS